MIQFWITMVLLAWNVGLTVWIMMLLTEREQMQGYIKRMGWERR